MGDGSGGTGNGTGAAAGAGAGAVGADSSEQQYSLRWNDFHHSILTSFRHLRDEEDFVDVTLACDGCSFTAHKVVLSACSPYFRRLLKANPCQHPIVILRDVKEKDMESLLRFMYNGEVHIGQDHLSDFLKTAQMLQVRGLADVPTGGRDSQNHHKRINTSNTLPWSHGGNSDIKDTSYEDPGSPIAAKRSRTNASGEHCFSPSPTSSHGGGLPGSTSNHLTSGTTSDITLLSQALEGGGPTIHTGNTSHQIKGASDSSLQAQSTGEDSNSSDPEERTLGRSSGGRGGGELVPKSEPNDYGSSPLDDSTTSHHLHHGNGAGLGGVGLDTPRTPTFPAALLGLQGIPGLLPGPSGIHNSNQEANFESWRGIAGAYKSPGPAVSGHGASPTAANNAAAAAAVAAAAANNQPKPVCPLCGKEYSNAGNLKQHIMNIHLQMSSENREVCRLCGKMFKTKQYLHTHLLQLHGIRQRAVKNLVNQHSQLHGQLFSNAQMPSQLEITPIKSSYGGGPMQPTPPPPPAPPLPLPPPPPPPPLPLPPNTHQMSSAVSAATAVQHPHNFLHHHPPTPQSNQHLPLTRAAAAAVAAVAAVNFPTPHFPSDMKYTNFLPSNLSHLSGNVGTSVGTSNTETTPSPNQVMGGYHNLGPTPSPRDSMHN